MLVVKFINEASVRYVLLLEDAEFMIVLSKENEDIRILRMQKTYFEAVFDAFEIGFDDKRFLD
ncbi:hypothetical protein B1199_17760 [Pseudoalteromonas ulvae]|uniref:Uncharacterized protein n=1 Tax=Pseudoalteromonas ulvae TaxID=107327 RepID=A0A244CMS2_PSEDV|nr:hypothetical protein B1199_17760 [Pseudoalteromonas ulvae]